jgi:hypothetical protein
MVGILGGIEDVPQTTQTRESTSTPTLVRLIMLGNIDMSIPEGSTKIWSLVF